MRKIAINTTSAIQYNKEAVNLLKRNNFEVIFNSYGRKLKREEILELCKDAVGIIAGTENLDEVILGNLQNLKVISRCGTGMDSVDLVTAKKLGIQVYNTPDAATLAVAELTIGLILNLLRKINPMDQKIRDIKWEKMMGRLLCGKKIGIIGFGRIGRKVADLLKPFACEVKYADPFLEDGLLGYERLSMEELLGWADIISIHISESKEIIGHKEIGLIKKGAYLLNLSRGGVINEQMLYQALKSQYLSGAALDVFEQEPYNGPLSELDNIILTPHIGSYAIEAREKMEFQAVENLLEGLEEEK